MIKKETTSIIIKITFSLLALWYVFQKVKVDEVISIIRSSDIFYLFLAFVFFNFSKIASSIRLNLLFKELGFCLPEKTALKLYYTGMFYNLFLPGGIGGDGYKIYLLKRANLATITELIRATVLDRVSGLIPLLIFAGILFIFSSFFYEFKWLLPFDIFGLLFALPSLWLIYRYLFSEFYHAFALTTALGFLTQALQLILAYFISKAFGVEESLIIDLLLLFLISSIVAVLPISFGGIGIREWVFLYGFSLLHLPVDKGVAFGVVFFLITAFSSMIGLFFRNEIKKSQNQNPTLQSVLKASDG